MAESRLALHAEGAAERAEAIRTGQLCFVGECHEVDVPIDYRSAAFSEASDLWRFNLHYHEFLLDLVAAERQPSESLSEKGDRHPASCIRIGQGTRPPGASPRFRTDSESWEDMVWRVVDGWMREHRPDDPQALRDAWHPFCISRRLPVWATLIALGSAEPGQRRACPKRGTGTLHLESGLGKRHDIREPVPVFGQALTGVIASMAAQANFLADHLERDLGGNHLLENTRGLAIAAAAIDAPDSDRWLITAERTLRRELPEQVLPHGEHFERSPGYHVEVLQMLLDLHDATTEVRPTLSALCGEHARPMARWLAAVLHPDGDLPLLADSTLLGAAKVQRVLDRAGVAPHRTAEGEPVQAGPYWIHRDGDDAMIFDAGPVGADHLPAHAHADLLGFEASIAGQRAFVDSGVHDYQDGEMRRYCRSSAAHNVLTVDDADQCDMWSKFRMGYRGHPGALITGQREGFHYAWARHDAYRRLGVPVTGRLVACRPQQWLIIDWATGRGRHRLTNRLHVHPSLQVELADGVFRLRGEGLDVRIAPLAVGETHLETGWYCPRFGQRIENRVLVWQRDVDLPHASGWQIAWGSRAEQAEPVDLADWLGVVQ